MECEFNRTPYKRRLDNYSGHERLIALMQPRKYSEDTFKMEFRRTRKRLQEYSEACSTRLRRARGLVKPRATGLRTWRTYSMIRDGIWSTRYINCNYSYCSRTTHTVVELVGTERNYPNGTQVGLLSSYLARISM
jgi:hypothetical protein